MSDLAAFLLARIAEDETWFSEQYYFGYMDATPRLLADCEAKRRIVELHPGITDGYSKNTVLACETCCQWDDYPSRVMGENPGAPDERYPCLTLRFLAAQYSSHPDFDPAWLVGGQGD